MLSTVIKFGGTVYDLEELELTYAPPYGSAKDPVNMAGFIASNLLRNDISIWHWHDIDKLKGEGNVILDVRTPAEHKARTIKGALNIPLEEIRARLDEIPKGKPIITFCEVGYRSYLATRILMQKGFNQVYELTGGFKTYEIALSTTEEIVAACGGNINIMEQFVKDKAVEDDEFMITDACGLSCPGPLNALITSLETLPLNKKLKIYATDPGFKSSVEAYAKLTEGVELLYLGKEEGKIVATLQKGKISPEEISNTIKPKIKTRKELRTAGALPISNIEAEELYNRLNSDDKPALLIDVRTPGEYHGVGGHINETKLIPLGDLMQHLNQYDSYKEEEIVLICHSGSRSMMAARLLAQAGFKDLRNLNGGMMMWHRKGFPTDKGALNTPE